MAQHRATQKAQLSPGRRAYSFRDHLRICFLSRWAKAYTADNLEGQLDAAVRTFVADKRQVSIESTGWTGSGRKATLNPIMQWYAKDFGGSEQAVKEFLAKHSANNEQAKD